MKISKTITHIIGIDEAGRGPLAGPVSIGVVKVHKDHEKTIKKFVREIKGKDSKKLSHTQRELWFETIKKWKQEGILDFHVALISNTHIDTKGISDAIKTGMKKCLKKVKAFELCDECFVKLDGSLKAPEVFKNQKTIIKGDEKEWIISLASIAAKVTRDAHMKKLSRKYKEYGFEVHKGYGTSSHRAKIVTFGPSKVHRMSFLRKISSALS